MGEYRVVVVCWLAERKEGSYLKISFHWEGETLLLFLE